MMTRAPLGFTFSAGTPVLGRRNCSTGPDICMSDNSVPRRTFCLAGAAVLLESCHVSISRASPDCSLCKDRLRGQLQNNHIMKSTDKMMEYYEKYMEERKTHLFSRIERDDVVIDIGIGTGPNLQYLPPGSGVIGIEPNEKVWSYASRKALKHDVELKMIRGYAEQLPLSDNSCDKVITTLTLCSVTDPSKCIKEIIRVLKPGGEHLFIEHVIAPPGRPLLRAAQNILNPLQLKLAGNCHLNRDTLHFLRTTNDPRFDLVAVESFDAKFGPGHDFISPIKPHICGVARKRVAS